MGMYNDLLDKVMDDGLFIKLVPGPAIRLRIIDHPWISQKTFVNQDTGETRIGTQFHWPVWDYAQGRVRILTQGKSVFKAIAEASETWDDGDQMPSPFDVSIKRVGTGQFDTEYTVTTVSHKGTMPPSNTLEMPDMAKFSKGIPVQQVLAGEKPPVLPPRTTGGAAEPVRPTHADVAALPEGDTSDDVVLTDIDPDKDINLDDIPF